jgi:uncharacterized protein
MLEGRSFSGFLSQLGLGIALGGAVIVCTAIGAKTYIKVKESQNFIQVKGYAEKHIVSENGVWTGTIKVNNPNPTEGHKTLDDIKKRVLDLLAKEGYDAKQIKVTIPRHHSVTKRTPDGKGHTNEIDFYTLEQNIKVFSTDVYKLADLPAKINELNLQGVTVDLGQLDFYYPSDKLDQLKASLMAEASKSAHDRAEQLAVSSGNRISRLLTARQGVFQVTSPDSDNISDSGIYDTSSIDKVVKIVVTMSFKVE